MNFGVGLRSSAPSEIARIRTSAVFKRVNRVEISAGSEVSKPVESKHDGLLALHFGQPIENGREAARQIEVAEADEVADVGQRGLGGALVGAEIEHGLRRGVVLDDGDAIAGGQPLQERMRSAHVAGFQEVNRRARFDQHQHLGRLIDWREIGDRLLDAIVEDVEVLAVQSADELAARIGDDHADVDAIDADANGWGRRILRRNLRA